MRILFLLLCTALPVAAAEDAAQVARKIAEVERQLPWFWSPILEGLSEAPYTFQMNDANEFADRSGKLSRAATALQLERIPLAGGAYYRCLSQDGASPCTKRIVDALEQDSKKAANFTPEERAKVKAVGEDRRVRRRAFWTDFPQAFKFQLTTPGRMSFTPTGKYHPQREPDTALLSKIAGELWYDPQTFEITRLDYRMLGDPETIARLYKGSTYSIADSTIQFGDGK